MLIDEINSYDQKTKEQEQSLTEGEIDTTAVNKTKIKDYKKTSLLKAVTLFEEFLRALEKAERNKKAENGNIFLKIEFITIYFYFYFADNLMDF